jgi:hypothetical protein
MLAFLGDAPGAEYETSQALAMGPESRPVIRDSTIAYEALGQREKALALMRKAPRRLLDEMSRQPDVRELQRDPRVQELLSRKPAQ